MHNVASCFFGCTVWLPSSRDLKQVLPHIGIKCIVPKSMSLQQMDQTTHNYVWQRYMQRETADQESLLTELWCRNRINNQCGICHLCNTFAYLCSVGHCHNHKIILNWWNCNLRPTHLYWRQSTAFLYLVISNIKVKKVKLCMKKKEYLWDAESKGIMKTDNKRNMNRNR